MAAGSFRFICAIAVLLATAALDAGGWVVITVTELPEYVVVGEPVTLTYGVRQHGMRLLTGLNGRIDARSGTAVVSTSAVASAEAGHYSAALTLPHAGDWTVDILSGFGGQLNSSQIILHAIERRHASPALSEAERGRRLFVAKGCITCHAHAAVAGRSTWAGLALTGKRYPAEYLKQFLARPPQSEPFEPPRWQMPDLQLQGKEIAALVAFLTADAPGTTQR